MKRILMRAARNPLSKFSPMEVLRRDLIGRNSGNLLFAAASHRLLSAGGVSVDTNAMYARSKWGDQANDEYDGVVLPLANCFRKSFANQLDGLAREIRKLRIPFAMLSGGVQAPANDTDFTSLKPIEESVKSFASAVLDHSSSLTVRGSYTAEYLASLGFKDVEVIGCPSMTRGGYRHRVVVGASPLGEARVAYGTQPNNSSIVGAISRLEHSGALMTLVGQDIRTLEMLIWWRDKYATSGMDDLPQSLAHPHFRDGQVVMFVDASTWIDWCRTQDVYIGTRIHGALAAVSAGRPSLLIAHDARTTELAAYHGVPHISESDLASVQTVDDVWARLDYTRFNAEQGARTRRVVDFLNRNGFRTILDDGEEDSLAFYDHSVARLELPGPVRGREYDDRELIGELRRSIVALEKRLKKMEAGGH